MLRLPLGAPVASGTSAGRKAPSLQYVSTDGSGEAPAFVRMVSWPWGEPPGEPPGEPRGELTGESPLVESVVGAAMAKCAKVNKT